MPHHKKYRTPWMLLPAVLCTTLPTVTLAQTAASSGGNQAADNELSPLVVTATRNKSLVGETPQKVIIITREQIEQQLAITSDPGEVLSNLIPSYSPSRQKLNNSGETFRGRSALFMVDGVPQSNPLRDGGRDSYTIDLSMVERIEVIHGASAEHGLGATGGIINYVTKRAEPGELNQHVGVSLTSDDDVSSDGLGHKLDYQVSGQNGDWDFLGGVTQQATVSSVMGGRSRFSQPMLSRSSNFTFLNMIASVVTDTSPKQIRLTLQSVSASVSFTLMFVSSTT